MSLALGIVKFEGAERAREVLNGYVTLHPTEDWPYEVGILVRHRLGRISVYQNFDYDWGDEEGEGAAAGLGFGTLTGLAIGALAGPPGMAAGAAVGGSMGGLLGAADEEANEEPLYDVVRGKMEKNTSAILLLADDDIVDEMITAFAPLGVDTIRRSVSDELRGRLSEAVRVVAHEPAQPGA